MLLHSNQTLNQNVWENIGLLCAIDDQTWIILIHIWIQSSEIRFNRSRNKNLTLQKEREI